MPDDAVKTGRFAQRTSMTLADVFTNAVKSASGGLDENPAGPQVLSIIVLVGAGVSLLANRPVVAWWRR